MRSRILVVDDNPSVIRLVGSFLAEVGDVRFAMGGAAALELARSLCPDIALLDAEMPGMSGYELCAAMKADPALKDIPIVFVTAHSGPELELKGLEAGAVDFIAKPVSKPLLVARVQTHLRLKLMTDELRRIARVDALTDVLNRRCFDEVFATEWSRAQRDRTPISVLMIDVDHFKLFNDAYGHPAGDHCLRSVAQALSAVCRRPADVVARYGGEEFVMLLPNTPSDGAAHVARRVLDAIETLNIPHPASPTAGTVRVSVGVSSYEGHGAPPYDRRNAGRAAPTAAELIESADRALYAAKDAGRARAFQMDVEDLSAASTSDVRRPRLRFGA